jgi:hypothetical protein
MISIREITTQETDDLEEKMSDSTRAGTPESGPARSAIPDYMRPRDELCKLRMISHYPYHFLLKASSTVSLLLILITLTLMHDFVYVMYSPILSRKERAQLLRRTFVSGLPVVNAADPTVKDLGQL